MGLLSTLFSVIKGAGAPTLAPVTPDRPTISLVPSGSADPGIALVQHYESCAKKLRNGMIAPYLDGKGVPTIGWGNTYYLDGTRVKINDPPITQAAADALFDMVYKSFRSRIAAQLPADAKVCEIGAFTCFAYNVGFEAFRTSTALKRFKAGDKLAAGVALEWFNLDDGKVELGLQRRRRAEKLVMQGLSVASAIAKAEADYPTRH